MAKSKNWAYTTLSEQDSVYLLINNVRYAVVEFVASFAANEIPRATCLLAIGRDARRPEPVLAQINQTGNSLGTVVPAEVRMKIRGEFDTEGQTWPEEEKVLFSGFFHGFAYRKVNGKIGVVAQLRHWLEDLGFSSMLSRVFHPANPMDLAYPGAVPGGANRAVGGGTTGQSIFLSEHYNFDVSFQAIETDLWRAIKEMLCSLANEDVFNVEVAGIEGVVDNLSNQPNTPAIAALARIEGPTADAACSRDYDLGVPLPLDTADVEEVPEAISAKLAYMASDAVLHQTFWDALVHFFLPRYMMQLIPLIDTAVVTAAAPGFREAYDVELKPEEYDSLDHSALIERPLRAVLLQTPDKSLAGASMTEDGTPAAWGIGGGFAAPGVTEGMLLALRVPEWAQDIESSALYAAASTGIPEEAPINEASAPGNVGGEAVGRKPSEIAVGASELLSRYARMLYVQNALRGREGAVSGKLRFDIAPGSNIRIVGSPERFLAGIDQLATTHYATVQRVTIVINAEAGQASTRFKLTNIRTESENTQDRFSIEAHPLFGDNVIRGLPLIKDFP